MRKVLNSFALSLLLAVSSAAISTANATVTTQTTAALAADTWVSLGAGPWILSSSNGTAQFAISDSTPSLSATTFFIVPNSPSISIQTISNVWVKSSTSAKPAYVTYAPISNGTVTISSGSVTISSGSATIGAVTQSGMWTTGRTWFLSSAGDSVSIGGTLPAFSSTPTVNIGTMPAVTGTFWQTTQPVSLVSLPSLASGSNTIGKVDQGAAGSSAWLVSGNVGGFEFQLSPTITVQNAAYSSGYSLGGTITVTGAARTNGGSGMLNGIRIRSKGGSTNTIWVYAVSKSPAWTCTDKAAFVAADGDAANALVGFPQSVMLASPGSWDTASYGQLTNLVANFTNKDTSPGTAIYICLVTAGSVTPATTGDLVGVFSGLQD